MPGLWPEVYEEDLLRAVWSRRDVELTWKSWLTQLYNEVTGLASKVYMNFCQLDLQVEG